MSAKKREKKIGILDYIKIVYKYDKSSSLIILILKIVEAIVPTVITIALAKIIDELSIDYNKSIISTKLMILLMIMFFSYIYINLVGYILNYFQEKLICSLRSGFKMVLITKIASVDYDNIEDDNKWNLISRVIREPEVKCKDGYMQLLNMLYLFLKSCGILLLLAVNVFWLPIIIVMVAYPLVKISINSGKVSYIADCEAEKSIRRAEYLSNVLTSRDASEERTMFGFLKKFNRMWAEQYEKARKIKFKALIKWYKQTLLGGIVTTILLIFIIVILLFQTQNGALSIGVFIAVVNAVISLIPDISWTLPDCLKSITECREYLKDVDNLARIKGDLKYLYMPSKDNIIVDSIEFKNVIFKYPNSDRNILNNLNFKIEKGKHYAFVGINGAGKTTIIKLLLGLYSNYQGQILINGRDLREFSSDEIKTMFSVVFQDYVKYETSLKDNIEMGNVRNCSIEKTMDAIYTVGLDKDIEKLKNGIDTPLGKVLEGGQDLSGGQWQKVAMARALINDATVRILDEPTAALDPINESRLYDNYKKISEGVTTIFISHRLASTRLADKIFVLKDGKVIEEGKFDELMSLEGEYANMFESQRAWYIYE